MLKQAIDKFGHGLYCQPHSPWTEQQQQQQQELQSNQQNQHASTIAAAAANAAAASATFNNRLNALERRLLDNSLNLDVSDRYFDARNKQIRQLADPVDNSDSVTLNFFNKKGTPRQTHNALHNKVTRIENSLKKLESECLRVNSVGDAWDAQNRRITNVAPSQEMFDASTLAQTCTYDVNINNFKCGNRTFNLVENSSNTPLLILSTDANGMSHIAVYGNPDSIQYPSDFIRWNFDVDTMVDAYNKEIGWDSGVNKMVRKRRVP